MPKFLLGLFLVAASVLSAEDSQRVVTILVQQCVWHAGDDLSWAAPTVDERGWQPLTNWKVTPDQTRVWIRCHGDLSALVGQSHAAVQVRFAAAYQVYLDGKRIGAFGNLEQGTYGLNLVASFPVESEQRWPTGATLALRATRHMLATNSGPINAVINRPVEFRIGDAAVLNGLRAETVLAQSALYLPSALCFAVVGILSVLLIALFLYDRSRQEFLLLSVTCLALTSLRLNEFAAASLLDYPLTVCLFVVFAGNIAITVTQYPIFFQLANRPVPGVIRVLMTLVGFAYFPTLVDIFVPADHAVFMTKFNAAYIRPPALILHIVLSFCPLIAFRPFGRLVPRLRPIAVLCGFWGLADLVWYGTELTAFPIFGLPNVFQYWGVTLLEARALMTGGLIAVLLGLLFREQRQATEQHAMLTGEVHAARNVQQYLIPAQLPATPGFLIKSQYRPAREVGGDFFQVLPETVDGSLLVVIGDVAGKGVEAGMLATLIVGAVRTAASFTSEPARILSLLNDRLCGRGLVTCLALRLEQDGGVALVNAGHLPPYLNGNELSIEGALPLGAVVGLEFPASRFTLAAGDTLLLMTDGVVEAQSSDGQLFGFDRVGELLRAGADGNALATAAQRYGQEDDITVLTLDRLGQG
jgi:hypothetical protein